jgi:hypothetical protein
VNKLAKSHNDEAVNMNQVKRFSNGVSQRNMSAHDIFESASTVM